MKELLTNSQAWSEIAANYDGAARRRLTPFSKEAVAWAELGEGDRVLDVACGPGTTTLVLAETVASVQCVDFAPNMIEQLRKSTNIPAIEYLFHEEGTPLPDLGGIQASLEKRTRHRRALMRMLFEYYDTDRLVICMDPSALELMTDFNTDRSTTRTLLIECNFTDDYLIGHAHRVGLAGDHTPQQTLERLLPTIRNDILHESDRIRDAGFSNYSIIRESDRQEDNAENLMQFFGLPQDKAMELAATPYLFAD